MQNCFEKSLIPNEIYVSALVRYAWCNRNYSAVGFWKNELKQLPVFSLAACLSLL